MTLLVNHIMPVIDGLVHHQTLLTGLVGYWPLESNCNDSTANALHGTLDGSSSFIVGKINNCVDFSTETGDYYLPIAGDKFGAAQFSISAWVYSRTAGNWHTVFSKSNGNALGNTCWYLGYNDVGTTFRFRVRCAASHDFEITCVNPTIGDWTHIVATFDGSFLNLYRNGIASVPVAFDGDGLISYPALYPFIGCLSGSDTLPSPWISSRWDGRLDEIGFWSRAITQDEVIDLYNFNDGIKYAATPAWPGVTEVKLSTHSTVEGSAYSVEVSNVVDTSANIIDPAHDTAAWTGVSVASHTTLPTGLLAYYGLQSNCNDSTISAMNGTLHGTATFVQGKINNCVNFAANGDYYLPQNAIFDTDYLSISCWLYVSSVGNWNGVVTKATNNGLPLNSDKHCWGIRLNSAAVQKITFSTVVGTTYDETIDIAQYAATTWHHIVGTYDGSYARLYVNGVNVASTARAGVLNKLTNLPIFIGTRCNDSSPPAFTTDPHIAERLNGRIDDVGIWDRALNQDEISTLYNNGYGVSY